MSSGGGFFGLFNYSKPGKGVRKDEPERSRFVQFWVLVKRKFWDLIKLNLLYILFCVPMVTIGPATAAMTYILRLYANEQPVFLFSDFWDAFKANWKQSFVYSLLIFGVTWVVTVAVRFYWTYAVEKTWMFILLGFSLMVALLCIMATFSINVMIVTLDLKLRHIIKNGFLLSILNMKTNFITFFFLAIIWLVMFLFFPLTIFIMLFITFSFTNFIIVYNTWPAVDKYTIQPFIEKQKEEGELEEEEDVPSSIFTDEHEVLEDDDLLDEHKKKQEDKASQAADDFLGRS